MLFRAQEARQQFPAADGHDEYSAADTEQLDIKHGDKGVALDNHAFVEHSGITCRFAEWLRIVRDIVQDRA